MKLTGLALSILLPLTLLGQERNPTQQFEKQNQQTDKNPLYRVQVVSRSVEAVSYRNRSGWTKVDFQGTSLAPNAKGTAQVQSVPGYMEIKVDVRKLPAARNFGPLFLTYVLWAITPEGHAQNLGEVLVNSDGNYYGQMTSNLQAFGLIITAEPYFAVRQPSDVVVMQNVIRKDTKGKVETLNANYDLLPRGQYTYHVPESEIRSIALNSDTKSPLQLYEAQNAVQIAQYAKADQYASNIYEQAASLLNKAQDYKTRKQWKPANMTAREAVQKAEDARTVSLRRQQEIAQQHQREEADAREAAERQKAEEAARQQQAAEAQAQRESQQRAAAEQAKQEADAARAAAAAEAEKARQAAAEAERLRLQAESEKNQLRQRLLQQFNAVLPTRETPRGLVVNMNDVLFDTGKYTLKEPARIALAKISGIVISHSGLNLKVEGYTDSTGSDAVNQKLSEQRAETVRDFLVQQGIDSQGITAAGYGASYPIASNNTREGRALNRRVALVVSGEVIGTRIGVPPSASSQDMNPPPPPSQGPGMNPPPAAPQVPPPPQ